MRLPSIILFLALAVQQPDLLQSLGKISREHGLRLVYDGAITQILASPSPAVPAVSLEGQLDAVLEGSGLGWTRIGKYIILRKHDSTNEDQDALLARKIPNLLNPSKIVSRRDAGAGSTFAGSLEVPQTMIRNTPVLFGEADVLKTLQLMPGINPGMEGFTGIFVRGGGADENLFLLDGVPMYNVNHALGLFSDFTPEAVRKVTMYKGAFPSRYGGRVSSIIDVRTSEGNGDRLRGSISAGLLAEKLYLEGPLFDGGTSFSLSARGMHTLLLDKPIRWLGSPLNYGFYDLGGKITHRFGTDDRLTASLYHGRDLFNYDKTTTRTGTYDGETYESTDRLRMDIRYGNTVAAVRWNHIATEPLRWEACLYGSSYDMALDNLSQGCLKRGETEESYSTPFRQGTGILDAGARIDFDWTPVENHLLTFGADAVLHRYNPQITSSTPDRVIGREISLYADDDILAGGHFTLNAGFRATLFDVQGRRYLSMQPRVSGRYAFDGSWSAKAAYARMTQYVHLLTTGSLSMPTDLWVPITKDIRPETSDIFSAGAFHTGLQGWEFSVEGWWKQMDGVIEYRDIPQALAEPDSWQYNVASGKGRSWGTELHARKSAGRTTGSLSYTLSWSERIFPDGSVNDGRWFPFKYDRRHNFNVNISHRFSEKVELSALWIIMSGAWFTVPEYQSFLITPDPEAEYGYNARTYMDYISSINNYRLPPTHRLDVGVSFHKQKKRGERTWTLGVYNLYDAMNPNLVWFWSNPDNPDPEKRRPALKIITFFTVMPNFSYTFNF